jgi:hypothetical protein
MNQSPWIARIRSAPEILLNLLILLLLLHLHLLLLLNLSQVFSVRHPYCPLCHKVGTGDESRFLMSPFLLLIVFVQKFREALRIELTPY